MTTSVELREQRAGLVKQAREILNRTEADGAEREMTPEESEAYDNLMAAVDALAARVAKLEQVETAEAELEEPADRAGRPLAGESRERERGGRRPEDLAAARDKRRSAYRHWLRTGEVRPELRSDPDRVGALRDTITGTDAKGGFLITPVEVSADIVALIQDQVFVRQLCQSAGAITTVTDAKKLGIRKLTAHMADADWTTEVQAVTEDTTMAFDRRDLEPQLISKLAKVSLRTIMLTSDAESIVNEELAYKFAVTEEKAFLTGNGTAKPLGIFTASASGISTARDVPSATATTFTADNLIDCKYNLKAGYMTDKSCAWVVSREFVKRCRKLKVSSSGGNDLDYVWMPGLTEGAPDRILDIPYYMSEYTPATYTAGLYVAVLGCFRYYRIAQLADVAIQRLDQLYAATNEIGFIGRRWVDGAPILEEAFSRLRML